MKKYSLFFLLVSFLSCQERNDTSVFDEKGSHWLVYIINKCYMKRDKQYYERWVFEKNHLQVYVQNDDGTFEKRIIGPTDLVIKNDWIYRNDSLFVDSERFKYKVEKIKSDSIILRNDNILCSTYNDKSGFGKKKISKIYILVKNK